MDNIITLMAQAADAAPMFDASQFEELAPPIQIALFLGALSFATAALVSLTAFTRIIIVLSFVRRALATQEIPPNQVMIGLALFLTLFVMAPTFEAINQQGIQPYLAAQKLDDPGPEGQVTFVWAVAEGEIRKFMLSTEPYEEIELFQSLAYGTGKAATDATSDEMSPGEFIATEPSVGDGDGSETANAAIPLKILVPAFIISELKKAFIIGFCIYIPFLLIDLVISTVLMSLGMMMMPPVVVSTPCKLLLFVLIEGWQLLAQALVGSFG